MSKPSISVTSKSFLFVINSILSVEGIDNIEYKGKRVPGHIRPRYHPNSSSIADSSESFSVPQSPNTSNIISLTSFSRLDSGLLPSSDSDSNTNVAVVVYIIYMKTKMLEMHQ